MPGQQREVTLRFLAAPTDVNFGGKVHGGAVMSWIDQAGYACAAGWSGRYCVTAYVGGIQFERPIAIGQLVEVRARVLHTGSTSMHIGVDVFARDPQHETRQRTTHCIVIFVAVDDARKPASVPTYVPASDEERELQAYVLRIAALRQAIEAERQMFLAKFERM
jgi:acyl-CoA hydrolase